ncbi:PI-PLC X domain-containing 1-like, partial [Paramuricea clavata]
AAINEKRTTSVACNGLRDLCGLRIDQITFPGSHNAGSGFDGLLYYWSGGIAPSTCLYRNHGKSFSEQLEFGIRYFDVDICYGETEALNCHCDPLNCAYTGSIGKGLSQIDAWMKSHPNEVIVIHFNHDAQNGYHAKIAESLEKGLLKYWAT